MQTVLEVFALSETGEGDFFGVGVGAEVLEDDAAELRLDVLVAYEDVEEPA